MKLFDKIQIVIAHIGQHIQVWRLAWRSQKQQEIRLRFHHHDVEFLPAALELQESPPSPLGRKLVYLIVMVFVFSVAWASIGEVDIITVAQGKIIPSDYSKIIQPLETGVIQAIHVRDGQHVKKGDLLIELDAATTTADKLRFGNERSNATVVAARLRALIDGVTTLNVPEDATSEFVQLQQQMLRDQSSEYNSKAQSAKLLIEQRLAALNSTKSNIKRLEDTLPLISERTKAIKDMVAKNYVSKTQYLELEEQRIKMSHELDMERHMLKEKQAALEDAVSQHESLLSGYKNSWQSELTQIETNIKSLSQEENKATIRTAQQTLVAPIDGVVQQLAVHTVGGVVTPAQQLMIIAPSEGELQVEAWIENKDIGFVNAGQTAEVKVEAFPFTKYGVIDGKLLHLSTDAVPMENVGHVYATRVSMGRTTMEVGDKVIRLSPGMNVSVEVKTGQRRVIEYFLDPVLRGFKETARER